MESVGHLGKKRIKNRLIMDEECKAVVYTDDEVVLLGVLRSGMVYLVQDRY